MTRNLALSTGVAAVLLVTASSASADPTPQQAMRSLQYLVGTWDCAHTVGDFSGTYTTRYTSMPGDLWIRQVYSFPATRTEPAWSGEFFLGYDARIPRWVRFGSLSTGMYFGMYSKPTSDASWSWDYVLPGPSGHAVWTKKSDAEYTVDGPSYTENGKPVTEHHVCKKSL